MCGIAGLIKPEAVAPEDIAAVQRMTTAQIHRGPDDAGFFSDERCVLGHRRLSILDLSPAGRQPMSNEDGRVWITFNGEIYNYQELRKELVHRGHVFRSQSDTEVIVHGYEEWGIPRLLGRLRGMFGFALYDAAVGLFLARDPLGIKPLYYHQSRNGLLFASELKALRCSGRVPEETDRDALIGFLLAGSVPAPLTMLKEVKCLLPGHYLTWKDNRIAITRYWDFSGAQPEESTASGLRHHLQQAVESHLVSDVPVGIFLSGGVDSSAVVALASRSQNRGPRPPVTLTIAFDEQDFNEASQARKIAEHFRTDHREIRVKAADFINEAPRVLAALDQPTNDGVNTYFVAKAAREAGLKVVLSGLGGDEMFWGYKHYRWLTNFGPWIGNCPGPLRKALAGTACAWGGMTGRENFRRMAFLSENLSTSGLYLALRGFFPAEQVMELTGASRNQVMDVAGEHFGVREGTADPADANSFNYVEVKRYLHDQLLRDSDIFSMAHSIELRVPLLHQPVVEAAAGALNVQKRENGIKKPLLVGAVDDPIVHEMATQPKRGFSFPMQAWMRSRTGALREMAPAPDQLDAKAVDRLWTRFSAGRLHWSRAWSMLALSAAASK